MDREAKAIVECRREDSCSVLQCVAVCCSVLQCVAVRCNTVSRVAEVVVDCRREDCCSVLQCVAVCCSVLQCAAVCCTTVSRVAQVVVDCRRDGVFDLCLLKKKRGEWEERIVAACHLCCSVLQRVGGEDRNKDCLSTAYCYNCNTTLQHNTATHCNTLQHTKIVCQQHNGTTATHCKKMRHTAAHCNTRRLLVSSAMTQHYSR